MTTCWRTTLILFFVNACGDHERDGWVEENVHHVVTHLKAQSVEVEKHLNCDMAPFLSEVTAKYANAHLHPSTEAFGEGFAEVLV